MAIKKSKRVEDQESISTPMEKVTTPMKKGVWESVGWCLLLLGGLAHMLPEQMAPLLNWSAYGVSLQMAVGTVSVVAALYYLLGD